MWFLPAFIYASVGMIFGFYFNLVLISLSFKPPGFFVLIFMAGGFFYGIFKYREIMKLDEKPKIKRKRFKVIDPID